MRRGFPMSGRTRLVDCAEGKTIQGNSDEAGNHDGMSELRQADQRGRFAVPGRRLFRRLTRLLITGCLHEDGLADFFDGFGGGTSRERILSIMKDSHIGSYGVIGLILYFALLYTLLSSLPLTLAGSAILAGDPFSKGVAGMIINRLPYARKEEEAKNKTVYSRMTTSEYTCCLFSALIPMFWLPEPVYLLAGLLPVLVFYFLTSLMKKKIQGYTGDCCGATFLLCELSFYLGIAVIYTTII